MRTLLALLMSTTMASAVFRVQDRYPVDIVVECAVVRMVPPDHDSNRFTVEDEGVFTMPWSATITYRRGKAWREVVCAENTRERSRRDGKRRPGQDREGAAPSSGLRSVRDTFAAWAAAVAAATSSSRGKRKVQGCSVVLVSDASGQTALAVDPGGGVMAPLMRSNSVLMQRVRQELIPLAGTA